MRFIRYNPSNGDIVAYGYMEDQLVQAEIDAGRPTLVSNVVADFDTWKVDLETKELIRVNPAVIEPIPQEILDLYNSAPKAP